MSEEKNHSRYINDPSLLVELCREVIEVLDAGVDDAEIKEKEAQLKEIARSIERLEKSGVAVPDVLRAEKTRLVSSLSIHAEASQALAQLVGDFEEILKDLRTRLGQYESATGTKKTKGKRSRTPKTPSTTLRECIITALKRLGGSAHKNEVLKYVGMQLEGKLLPGDMEWRESTNDYAWQNNTCWERFRMTQDGVLRSDSPRGTWELSEEYQ